MKHIYIILVIFACSCRPIKNYVHYFDSGEICSDKFDFIELLSFEDSLHVFLGGNFPDAGGDYYFRFKKVPEKTDVYSLSNKEEILMLSDSLSKFGYSSQLSPFISSEIKISRLGHKHLNLLMNINSCGCVDLELVLYNRINNVNYWKQFRTINTLKFFEDFGKLRQGGR
jgi:hypothetical protein